jgi:non-ribosomal peptide synthase protein (TIGR01720 family)
VGGFDGGGESGEMRTVQETPGREIIASLSESRKERLLGRLRAEYAGRNGSPESLAGMAGARKLVAFVTLDNGGPRLDSALIEAVLRERLPGYMVPGSIRILDSLPTNANGKVDRAALSRWPGEVGAKSRTSRPSSDGRVRALSAIWERVLGIERVHATDNFFELGGDSILAIQVVSAARKAGMPLSVSQLFKHPTVQELVLCVADEKPVSRSEGNAGETTGKRSTVSLTPIQQWFWENRFLNPDHWNQSFLLEIDAAIPFSKVEESFRHLYESHEALRLFVRERPTSVTQGVWEAAGVGLPIQHRPIRRNELADEAAIIVETANAMHVNLRLSEGHLLRATFFSKDNGEPNKLLLIAHHWCVDAVSWRILFEELAHHLVSTSSAGATEYATARDRYVEWTAALEREAGAERLRSGLEFWRSQDYHRCPSIPLDHGTLIQNVEGSVGRLSFTLSEGRTRELLGQGSTRGESVQTVLVASLATVLRDWLDATHVLIGMEGHGRKDIGSEVNGADLVGWFTSYYPVVLDLRYADSPEQTLLDIRWQLARVPDDGHSYGLLRYGHPELFVRDDLASRRQPEITFNYLGRAIESRPGAPFSIIGHGIGADRDPGNRRTSLFEITARIVENRLRVDWQYGESNHRRATVEKLTRAFAATLDRVVRAVSSRLRLPADVAADTERDLVLTDGQQALLLHHLGRRDNDLGELTLSGDLVGSVTEAQIEAAWSQTVARHPALRGTIYFGRDAAPVLRIRRASRHSFDGVDLGQLSNEEQAAVLGRLVEQKKRERINVRELPAMHLTLIRLSEERYRFIWRCHHVFLDGWSSALVLQEWLNRLNGSVAESVPGSNASAAFYEYYDWVGARPMVEAGRFWSNYQRGCRPCHLVEGAAAAPADQGKRGRGTVRDRPRGLSLSEIRAAAARYRVTPSALLIGSWAILLSNLTRRRSVCFGLVHSGRNAPTSNPDVVVGNLSNLAPFRVECDWESDVGEWVRRLMAQQENVSRHGHVSTLRMATWLTEVPDSGFFDTTVTIGNYPPVDVADAVRLENFEGDTTSTYPVSVSIAMRDAIEVVIDYDTGALSSERAGYLVTLYVQALSDLCQGTFTRSAAFGETGASSDFRRWAEPESRREETSVRSVGSNLRVEIDEARSPRKTEERLLGLFREALSVKDCGPDDSFFDLGGTSIQAVRLFNAIEKVFRRRLAVATLFQHPTAGSLSLFLEGAGGRRERFRSLVVIRRGHARVPPLFLIHAGGLEVLFYRELADHLDPQLSVYGLQPVGLDGRESPLDDVRTIARRYLGEIQAVHPRGPYFLLGHCFGVTIAFEMAVQLANRNFDVPLLVSVDGPAPRTVPVQKRAVTRPKDSVLIRAKGRLVREVAALKEAWRYRWGEPAVRREILYKRIQQGYVRAVGRYTTCRYGGHVLHFKCRDSEVFPNHSDFAWKHAVPRVDIRHVDCSHFEVLKRPHVTGLAEAIVAELNARYFSGDLTDVQR